MSKQKCAIKRALLLPVVFFTTILSTIIFGPAAYAAASEGIIEDANHIRWEYILDGDLTIRFYDKPANLQTITVPSLNELINLVPGASNSLDTYILENADVASQDADYATSFPRREATATTTKLDMSNTSKIQIFGVSPIIDPEVETELVFGENMVIGDVVGKVVTAQVCRNGALAWSAYNGGYYYCNNGSEAREFKDFESNISGWDDMTDEEKENYVPTPADLGCELAKDVQRGNYTAGKCYLSEWSTKPNSWSTKIKTVHNGRAFAGYKLKLTNFSNFNYVGWESFADSTFADTSMVISQSGLMGGDIFRNTNVEEVRLETEAVGPGLFRDCASLATVSFANNITRVPNDMFAGSGLTSIDFSDTSINTIGPRAFEGASLTSVNFNGINKIEYGAFRNNNIAELVLPKSINYLESDLFYGNKNMKKVTIAYDTLTSGTTLPFFVVADGSWRGKGDQNASLNHVEELTVLAPYGEDEEVSPTHISYDDYRWRYNCYTQERLDDDIRNMDSRVVDRNGNMNICSAAANGYAYINFVRGLDTYASDQQNYKFEDDFANVTAYKNVIAPIYFYNFDALKKITVGDGYEYVGTAAFWSQPSTDFGADVWDTNYGNQRSISSLTLPEGLKGIGNLAFGYLSKVDISINLPESLEFIGQSAFTRTYYMKNDIDLPNLKYIGDHAFAGTMVHDVYLHDTTRYLGYNAFWGDMNLNDITIDFDFFSPDIENWTLNGVTDSYGDSSYKTLWFGRMFGNPYSGYLSAYGGSCNVETHLTTKGFRCDVAGGYDAMKYGAVTFTDKNVSPFPSTTGDDDSVSFSGNSMYKTLYDSFFGFDFFADKVDISKTGWKVLPSGMFGFYSRIGEVSLPENLEVISRDAFNSAWINEEITIPDSVKIIGDHAFNPMAAVSNMSYGTYKDYTTPKVSKLPSSLEYVGYEAFYGDDNLTADLNTPNLKFIGARAFQGTKLRDVYLGDVQSLREGTFAHIPTLRNITIDTDFSRAVTAEVDTSFTVPQSLLDMFGGDETKAKNAVAVKDIHDKQGETYSEWNYDTQQYDDIVRNLYGKDYETFYTIFNKTMKESTPGTHDGQATAGEEFGELKFTDKNITELGGMIGNFSFLTFDKVDMGATKWKKTAIPQSAFKSAKIGTLVLPGGLETVTTTTFEGAEVTNEFILPVTLKTLERGAFQFSDVRIANALPDSVTTIDGAAFYDSSFAKNLTIPASVTSIGFSAFNAGSKDVHYDTITIKPELTAAMDSGQLVHQLFWNAAMDKMIIESSTLPALSKLESGANLAPYDQEFYSLPLEEVVFTKLKEITWQAFVNCNKLKKVDASSDANLRAIDEEAFLNAEKLHIFKFSPALKNETVTVGKFAFKGTAFETMGDAKTDFDLTAAKFDARDGFAFSEMPRLRSVSVPNGFSNNTIPVATFAKDDELAEASIDYKINLMDRATFANDDKLERIFVWGNTVVKDDTLENYVAPNIATTPTVQLASIRLAADNDSGPVDLTGYGPTIPEPTDIYAYSVSPTEAYAATQDREEFDSDFYALDEVLYITSNKPRVLLNDAGDDFDKSNLVVYGLRRDGVIVQSNSWGEFDGTVYPRGDSNLTFERMAGFQEENPVYGAVYDTPVPLNELDYGNVDFTTIDFELIRDSENADVRLVNIIYTDKYTQGKPDTDIDPNAPVDEPTVPEKIEEVAEEVIEKVKEIIPDTPFTGDRIGAYVISFVALGAIATIFILKRRK